jgi:hypothetical protein
MKSSNMQLLGFMSVPSGCIFATMESNIVPHLSATKPSSSGT